MPEEKELTNLQEMPKEQIRAYCLEKALEAYKYNQSKELLDLASMIEDYLFYPVTGFKGS